MNIQNLEQFTAAEKAIGEKTMAYIQQVGWKKAESVLSEVLKASADAREAIIETLQSEDFERWFQIGLKLNSKDYDSYSVLGIEEEAKAIRLAYQNKYLMREVFNNKVAGYKEAQSFLESLSA